MNLRFHWRLLQGGERLGASRLAQITLNEAAVPDLPAQTVFCHSAVAAGTSLLVDFSYAKPDPMLLAGALAMRVIRLMMAVRSGLLSPPLFVQQVNTFSQLTGRRICLNAVAGYSREEQGYYGDFPPHDERYARTEEFLEICQSSLGWKPSEFSWQVRRSGRSENCHHFCERCRAASRDFHRWKLRSCPQSCDPPGVLLDAYGRRAGDHSRQHRPGACRRQTGRAAVVDHLRTNPRRGTSQGGAND